MKLQLDSFSVGCRVMSILYFILVTSAVYWVSLPEAEASLWVKGLTVFVALTGYYLSYMFYSFSKS